MADASTRSVVPSLLPDALQQRALQQMAAAGRGSVVLQQMPSTQPAADSDSAPARPAAELTALQNLTIQGQGYGEGSRRQSRAHDSSTAGPGLPSTAQSGQMTCVSGQENVNSAGALSVAIETAGADDTSKDERGPLSLPGDTAEGQHVARQAGACLSSLGLKDWKGACSLQIL